METVKPKKCDNSLKAKIVCGHHKQMHLPKYAIDNKLCFRFACVLKDEVDYRVFPRDLFYDLIKSIEELLSIDQVVVEQEEIRKVEIIKESPAPVVKAIRFLWNIFAPMRKHVSRNTFSTILEYKKIEKKVENHHLYVCQYDPFSVIFYRNKKVVAYLDEEFWTLWGGFEPYLESYTLALYTSTNMSNELIQVCSRVIKEHGVDDISMIQASPTPIKTSLCKRLLRPLIG